MSTPEFSDLPESTGLAGVRPVSRQARRAWWRQAEGIFRATQVVQLSPNQAMQRASALLALQLLLVVVALVLLSAGPRQVAPEWGTIVKVCAALLLAGHFLKRLGGTYADVLRDVDQQVLDTFEAAPLASSAYVAGKIAFYAYEQVFGLALLLPVFALSHLLGGLRFAQILVVVLIVVVASVVASASAMAAVLRAHSRRARGVPIMPSQRPALGPHVAVAIFGLGIASALIAGLREGASEPALHAALAFVVSNPVVCLWVAVFDAVPIALFGLRWPLWLVGCGWLALMGPLWVASACLRWKPAPRSTGATLRGAHLLAWVPVVLVLAGVDRSRPAVWQPLSLAALLLVIVPAWVGACELAWVGDRTTAPRRRLLGMQRRSAPWFALAVTASALSLLGLLLPAPLESLALGLVLAACCAPVVLAATALGGALRPSRAAMAVVACAVLIGSGVVAMVGPSVDASGGHPRLQPVADGLGPAADLVSCASPAVLLPVAAAGIRHDPALAVGVGQPAGASWVWGLALQAAVLLPIAWLLSRRPRAARRRRPRPPRDRGGGDGG